jgi:endonuclease-3
MNLRKAMKSTKTDKKKRELLTKVINTLRNDYPEAKIQLFFQNDFQLMVATILSAQCTDKRVNIVTNKLFKKHPTVFDFAELSNEELEKEIFSTGYYKAKAKNIIASAKKLIADHEGKVPDNMDDLLKVPGVGRKTANVLLGHLFDIPAIVVDTHVIKIMNRLGIMETKNAQIIERELMELIDKKDWVIFTHLMISHGRAVCSARKPKCEKCNIQKLCPASKVYLMNS